MIEYQVFASSIHGSDLVTKDTFEEAQNEAIKWSMSCIDTDIVITKVETTIAKKFRNGGEVA